VKNLQKLKRASSSMHTDKVIYFPAMDTLSKFISNVFGRELSGGYAILFLTFVLACIGFVIWMIYYAVAKKGISELSNISWLSLKDTFKYTMITVVTITVFSAVLFFFDFGVDKIVNIIIENAK
jgi:preprotein translocase SecE subunit